MRPFYKELGRRIKALRQKTGLTQEELAEIADLHVSYIGHVEKGTKQSSLKTIRKISDALNISLAELFNFTKKPKIKKEDIAVKYLYKVITSLNKKDRDFLINIIKMIITFKKK